VGNRLVALRRTLNKSWRSIIRALTSVSADVIASRVRAALIVDVGAELARYSRPLLCLYGQRDRLVGRRSSALARAVTPVV
jgi:hypothetical protein